MNPIDKILHMTVAEGKKYARRFAARLRARPNGAGPTEQQSDEDKLETLGELEIDKVEPEVGDGFQIESVPDGGEK